MAASLEQKLSVQQERKEKFATKETDPTMSKLINWKW